MVEHGTQEGQVPALPADQAAVKHAIEWTMVAISSVENTTLKGDLEKCAAELNDIFHTMRGQQTDAGSKDRFIVDRGFFA